MKFYVADHAAMDANLSERYGQPTEHYEKDTYYEAPTCLRIRESKCGDERETCINVKGPLLSTTSKSREEVNLVVADAKEAQSALKLLGYREKITLGKHRLVYETGTRIKVMLDNVAGLGSYVELEILADDLAAGEAELAELARNLGLENQIQRGYCDLAMEKWKYLCKHMHIRTQWCESGPYIWMG